MLGPNGIKGTLKYQNSRDKITLLGCLETKNVLIAVNEKNVIFFWNLSSDCLFKETNQHDTSKVVESMPSPKPITYLYTTEFDCVFVGHIDGSILLLKWTEFGTDTAEIPSPFSFFSPVRKMEILKFNPALLMIQYECAIWIWNLKLRTFVKTYEITGKISSFILNDDSTKFAVTLDSHLLQIWDVKKYLKPILNEKVPSFNILNWSSEGEMHRFIAYENDCVWDLAVCLNPVSLRSTVKEIGFACKNTLVLCERNFCFIDESDKIHFVNFNKECMASYCVPAELNTSFSRRATLSTVSEYFIDDIKSCGMLQSRDSFFTSIFSEEVYTSSDRCDLIIIDLINDDLCIFVDLLAGMKLSYVFEPSKDFGSVMDWKIDPLDGIIAVAFECQSVKYHALSFENYFDCMEVDLVTLLLHPIELKCRNPGIQSYLHVQGSQAHELIYFSPCHAIYQIRDTFDIVVVNTSLGQRSVSRQIGKTHLLDAKSVSRDSIFILYKSGELLLISNSKETQTWNLSNPGKIIDVWNEKFQRTIIYENADINQKTKLNEISDFNFDELLFITVSGHTIRANQRPKSKMKIAQDARVFTVYYEDLILLCIFSKSKLSFFSRSDFKKEQEFCFDFDAFTITSEGYLLASKNGIHTFFDIFKNRNEDITYSRLVLPESGCKMKAQPSPKWIENLFDKKLTEITAVPNNDKHKQDLSRVLAETSVV